MRRITVEYIFRKIVTEFKDFSSVKMIEKIKFYPKKIERLENFEEFF